MEEPRRRSFLDVLKRNLSLSDRFGHTTRFAYIGEYFGGSEDELIKVVGGNVHRLNEEYGQTILSGLLLIYPRHFVHVIAGSEEPIYRHLQAVLVEDTSKILGRIIRLPAYHNVYRMYFKGWFTASVKNPPMLLDRIENVELNEIQKQIRSCLAKLYSLSEYLMDAASISQEKMNEALKNLDKTVPYFLPEITVVEYLLTADLSVLEDLRDYLEKFNEIPFLHFYNGKRSYMATAKRTCASQTNTRHGRK
ncbi:hypothetical protein QAD02_005470 [Eretmocerus hayati]|uniref:Uncharacterized protein n=1 Tax=Eretmocerus hayati TaxID=131215 RepID=A0ACC2NTL8_9HYME|nr:hypothetical protein QAD02_005470 [Eretmocerus hayati]